MQKSGFIYGLAFVLTTSRVPQSSAFSLAGRHGQQQRGNAFVPPAPRYGYHARPSSKLEASASSIPSVVVVSPPGGVGEASAVRAASMGSSVRWFVVSNDGSANQRQAAGGSRPTTVTLSSQALDLIEQGGGSLQLAGATVSSVLADTDDPGSAVPAISAWCGSVASNRDDAVLICTFDGIDGALMSSSGGKARKWSAADDDVAKDPATLWRNAVKVVAEEASGVLRGTKIAILSATEDDEPGMADDEDDSDDKGGLKVGSLVGSLFGGKKPAVPPSLTAALSQSGGVLHKLRHGELFGTPESSPEFSPLVGGPKRIPDLCEEYTMRSVRVDPTLSVSGNLMMGSSTRSSRHAVGDAAALLALGKVKVEAREGLDVCVSSLRGSEVISDQAWDLEFQRVQSMMAASASSSGAAGGAPILFSAEFASVPDVKRLADWYVFTSLTCLRSNTWNPSSSRFFRPRLATKWAPAILRTYDIAAIRVGARPVYASRVGENGVEIVWQQLVDFSSVTVGKMSITVSDTGLVATRGAGDPDKGFGTVSRKPLSGEDVLVRRLADAVAQATEKGLARKVRLIVSMTLHAPHSGSPHR
jgi:hypothetical protein